MCDRMVLEMFCEMPSTAKWQAKHGITPHLDVLDRQGFKIKKIE